MVIKGAAANPTCCSMWAVAHLPGSLSSTSLLPCCCPMLWFSADCPPEQAKPIYLEYAALEEQHGLARHAMEVYERAIPAVPKDQRLSVVELYISRATDFFGIAKVGCTVSSSI